MSDWQDEVAFHRVQLEARNYWNAFFEKLALLDGGTVALVITAILGPLHGAVRNRYLMCVGLSVLVIAMLVLLQRTLWATEFEFYIVAETTKNPEYFASQNARSRRDRLYELIRWTSKIGVWLSAAGIVLLLVEVWLVVIRSAAT